MLLCLVTPKVDPLRVGGTCLPPGAPGIQPFFPLHSLLNGSSLILADYSSLALAARGDSLRYKQPCCLTTQKFSMAPMLLSLHPPCAMSALARLC